MLPQRPFGPPPGMMPLPPAQYSFPPAPMSPRWSARPMQPMSPRRAMQPIQHIPMEPIQPMQPMQSMQPMLLTSPMPAMFVPAQAPTILPVSLPRIPTAEELAEREAKLEQHRRETKLQTAIKRMQETKKREEEKRKRFQTKELPRAPPAYVNRQRQRSASRTLGERRGSQKPGRWVKSTFEYPNGEVEEKVIFIPNPAKNVRERLEEKLKRMGRRR